MGNYRAAEKLSEKAVKTRARCASDGDEEEKERQREVYLTPREREGLQPPEGHMACRRLSNG
jgi:hypothetical protein